MAEPSESQDAEAQKLEAQKLKAQREAAIRADNLAPQVRRHTWINIAGPIAAVFLGIAAAAIYLRPIDVLRFIQISRLGWSGVVQNDLALKDTLITYLVTGGYAEQEPVVMIHGLGPNAALVWRGVMPLVASAHFKVVAPNLPGFGSSEHKQVNYSIAYQAAAVAQMIDALKIDKINLVASDLGADVALYYAVDHPDKVERIVLVGGGLAGKRGADKLRAGMLPTTVEAIRAQAQMSLFDLPPLPEVIYERMMMELARDMQAQTDMLNSVPRDEAHIRSKIGQIFNTLTIIIWGARSPFFAAAEGEALHAALPGSATVVFKTSGAFPQLEHPDDFADSLIFVMKQTEGGR
ncbi:MAG: alpha/beta hydrolase [Candidatus Binatus sp.]|uniref:alpha/beta fold hydrolase n=1 Tax=Candidatus Binatus sp. TaxID=2811406 RepID=UPI002717605E|nr:alpha/beta hydrolase [Candidatus Binatus sp.]MDO8431483.1 alpha/beta hydrolase [Candidatus Binatus sp.]